MTRAEYIAWLDQQLSKAYDLLTDIQRRQLAALSPIEGYRLELDEEDIRRNIHKLEQTKENLGQPVELEQLQLIQPQANPFIKNQPAKADNFVGRKDVLVEIIAHIENGNSMILLGERGIGKSSLLRHLHHYYSGKQSRSKQNNYLPFFVDLTGPDRIEKHFARLVKKLGGTGNTFENVMEALEGQRVILFMDELQVAPKRGLQAEELAGLLKLEQEADMELRLVVASDRPAKQIYPAESDSLVYKYLFPRTLNNLSQGESFSLLDLYLLGNPLLFEPNDREALLQVSQGHPFKLMRAAYHLYKALTEPEADYDWQAAYGFEIANMM